MTNKQQAYAALKDYLDARKYAPWTAAIASRTDEWNSPKVALQRLNGMAGDWDLSVINDW